MSEFIAFANSLLKATSDFLMTEPIKWFVGVVLVGAVGALVKSLTKF